MYAPLTIASKYARYRLFSSNGKGHGIHSPFVFDFVTKVMNDRTLYPDYEKIESMRRRLLADPEPVPYEDYGAGSQRKSYTRSVAAIAATSAKNKKYGQLLYRTVRYFDPHYIVELGTSLGVSTAYLATGNSSGLVISGEGNDALATLAGRNLGGAGIRNVKIITGHFDNTLPQMLSTLPRVDLAFIDGNHREQPTLSYFHQLLNAAGDNTVLIFDDIHWSAGMESAWKQIIRHPSVTLSIDLFFMGLVFFRKSFQERQHFTIRF